MVLRAVGQLWGAVAGLEARLEALPAAMASREEAVLKVGGCG